MVTGLRGRGRGGEGGKEESKVEWRREGRRRLQEGGREEETVDRKRRKSDVKLIGCSLMGAGLRERR